MIFVKPIQLLSVLLFFFIIGMILHIIPETKGLMSFLTPWFLLFSGVLVLYYSKSYLNKRFWIWAVICFVATFSLESIGVATKAIFGPYHYGTVLGASAFGVPFIIGFNWMIIIWGTLVISGYFTNNIWLIVAFSAALATGFDFLLEPMAIKYGYWVWETSTIPLQNYVAWFVIAFLFGLLSKLMKVDMKSILASGYFLIQVLFFFCLNFINEIIK